MAEHALALAEQCAERPVIGAAAQYVLRAVYRQLVRSRQRHVPGGEKPRPGEPARRSGDLLSRAGESARRRGGIALHIFQRLLDDLTVLGAVRLLREREELFGVLRRERERVRALDTIAFSVHVRPFGV